VPPAPGASLSADISPVVPISSATIFENVVAIIIP
jgi:hypothetical protein